MKWKYLVISVSKNALRKWLKNHLGQKLKNGGDKEQLLLTMNEQQDVWDAIVDLKQFPERDKDLKLFGLMYMRAANNKVRVHSTINELKKNIYITRIEFRAKLYHPISEYFYLIGDDL